jgi:RNA polymerase sigma-70 factor, ECF subfamily
MTPRLGPQVARGINLLTTQMANPGGLLLRISNVTATGSQEPRNRARPTTAAGAGPSAAASTGSDLAAQIGLVARGDSAAFDAVFEQIGPSVFGVVKRVIRDPAQSEEVTQEVMLEVWRTAAKFDAGRGSATAWVMTLAHRRAVDRVRSVQAESERERRIASAEIPFDEVLEAVESSLERERVRRCLNSLTEVQRESVTLAYYRGYTYGQVASLLGVPTGTVKTRMRDALIRLRDCLGVAQ